MVRDANSNDLNYILDSFKNSVKYDTILAKTCRSQIFNKEFPKVIDHILSTAKTIVACVKDEPSVIVGYLIYSSNVIHYCLVKEAFRKLRLCWMMMAFAFGIEDRALQCSLLTEKAKKILILKPNLKIEYNPFLLFHRSMA